MSILEQRLQQISSIPMVPQAIPMLQRMASNPTDPNAQLAAFLRLNEIKQAQQQLQAQQAMQNQPQGTVKDQTIQATGILGLQNQRAQQGMQQMAQAAAQGQAPTQPQQPVAAMARGGIAGVKRYADGGEVEDEEKDTPRRTSGQAMLSKLLESISGMAESERGARLAQLKDSLPAQLIQGIASIKGGPQITYRNPEGTPSIYAGEDEWRKYRGQQAKETPVPEQTATPAPDQTRPSVGTPAGVGALLRSQQGSSTEGIEHTVRERTREQEAANRAGAQQVIGPQEPSELDLANQVLRQGLRREYTPPTQEPKPEALRQPVGGGYEQYLQQLTARDQERRQKFETDQEARKKENFFKALIAAGQATGSRSGFSGIASALGGFGAAGIAGNEALRERASEHDKLLADSERVRQMAMLELEKARRAEARGDWQAAEKHRENAADAKQKFDADKERLAAGVVQRENQRGYWEGTVENRRTGATGITPAERAQVEDRRIIAATIKSLESKRDKALSMADKAKIQTEIDAELQKLRALGGASAVDPTTTTPSGGGKILTEQDIAATMASSPRVSRQQILDAAKRKGWQVPAQ